MHENLNHSLSASFHVFILNHIERRQSLVCPQASFRFTGGIVRYNVDSRMFWNGRRISVKKVTATDYACR